MRPPLTFALATHSRAVLDELDALSNDLDITLVGTLGESQLLLGVRDAKLLLGLADRTTESLVECVLGSRDTSLVLE